MRWLVDECISASLVAQLRKAGHDVVYVAEFAPATDDVVILQRSVGERRLLLTEDKDFGDLVFGATERPSFGVVMLRIRDERAAMRWPRLSETIERFGEKLFGAFTVVGEARIRTRKISRS
jgi:predicted nuclease of predicted toxin-antitoxin system